MSSWPVLSLVTFLPLLGAGIIFCITGRKARDKTVVTAIIYPSIERVQAQALEAKCGHLLSAQREYIRTIRVGNPRWATA